MPSVIERLIIVSRQLAEAHNSLGQSSFEEHELWAEGYYRSQEPTPTGRANDARVHSVSRRSITTKLEHQIAAYVAEIDCLNRLLDMGITDSPHLPTPRMITDG